MRAGAFPIARLKRKKASHPTAPPPWEAGKSRAKCVESRSARQARRRDAACLFAAKSNRQGGIRGDAKPKSESERRAVRRPRIPSDFEQKRQTSESAIQTAQKMSTGGDAPRILRPRRFGFRFARGGIRCSFRSEYSYIYYHTKMSRRIQGVCPKKSRAFLSGRGSESPKKRGKGEIRAIFGFTGK